MGTPSRCPTKQVSAILGNRRGSIRGAWLAVEALCPRRVRTLLQARTGELYLVHFPVVVSEVLPSRASTHTKRTSEISEA